MHNGIFTFWKRLGRNRFVLCVPSRWFIHSNGRRGSPTGSLPGDTAVLLDALAIAGLGQRDRNVLNLFFSICSCDFDRKLILADVVRLGAI